MANRTAKDAKSMKGTNPQYLVEKIIRTRIYDSKYWKESCFGLSAELMVDRAMELRYVGGIYAGNVKPAPFLCLTLKLLQIQPDKDIIIEFIRREDFKYVRALGAMYLRLTGTSPEIFQYLEPLFNDYRKLRFMGNDGKFSILHMDEFVDQLLRDERVCDIQLPRLQKREFLEEAGTLTARVSALDEDLDNMSASSSDEEDPSSDHEQESRREKKEGRDSPSHAGGGGRSPLRRSRRSPSPSTARQQRRSSRSPPRHHHSRSQRSRSRDRDRGDRDGDRDRDRDRGDRDGDRDRDRDRGDRDGDRDRDRDRGDRDGDRDRKDRGRDRDGGGGGGDSRSSGKEKDRTRKSSPSDRRTTTASSSSGKDKLKLKSDGKVKEDRKRTREDSYEREIKEANELRAKLGLAPLQ